MSKAFLSYSSKQKQFVEKVAKGLGIHAIVDFKSFEEGMGNFEEMFNKLDNTDLFVVFLSEIALNSKYVQEEIRYAKSKLDINQIQRIYPLIIDGNISHNHALIPDWLKDLNLKQVLREGKALLLIRRRLREIVWDKHPLLKERSLQFVGRFELTRKIQERLDNIDSDPPLVLIASGLPNVGRRTLLRKALIDSRVLERDSYDFPTISMNSRESIEDFIVKIYDLGLSEERSFDDLIDFTLERKVNLATELLLDVYQSKEIIAIEDRGGIILPDSQIATWFTDSINLVSSRVDEYRPFIGIISEFRIRPDIILRNENFFHISVPELSKKERSQLLKRSAKLSGLNLQPEDYDFFLEYVNGFPTQIHYCVDIISNEGLREAKKKTNQLINFQKELFSAIVSEIQNDIDTKDILTLLTEFDFISFDLLYTVLHDKNQEKIDEIIEKLIGRSVFEYLGSNKEYIRLNDGIRDFLQRADYAINAKYRTILKQHIENFAKNETSITNDLSDFFYSLRGALLANYKFQNKLLLPSHYLKAIIFLYERDRNYDDVVILSDRVLEKSSKIDLAIKREIQYWLCQALARKGDDRFKNEVQVFKDDLSNYHFLFGFYYRFTGKPEYALESLKEALRERPKFPRAQRELVQVLRNLELYSEALNQARLNYENEKNNAFHIQAYFDCLIKSPDSIWQRDQLRILIGDLERINTDKSTEMARLAEADFALYIENDIKEAVKKIDTAIDAFGSSPYSLRRKFDILERGLLLSEMEKVLTEFNKKYSNGSITDRYTYNIMLAKFEAHKGDKAKAKSLINTELRFYPERTKNKILLEIDNI